jgi:hypothetical protein
LGITVKTQESRILKVTNKKTLNNPSVKRAMNTSIRELTTQILSSRTISQIDRENMSALLRREDLDDTDRTLIERVFTAFVTVC